MNVKIVVESRSQMKRLVEQLRTSIGQSELTDAGRRGRWRMVFGTIGTIKPDEQEFGEPIFITTRDISEEGVGFVTRHALEPGLQILLSIETDTGDIEVPATIRHCTKSIGGMMKAGVEFDLKDE